MKKKLTTDVTIIGGGISGLSLAFYLKELGIHACIIEKSSRTGGVISAKKISSFSTDIGPQSFLSEPDIIDLISELKLSDSIVWPAKESKKRFLSRPHKKNNLIAFPHSLRDILKGELLSLTDLKKILTEFFSRHTKGIKKDIHLYQLLSERFGEALTRKVLSAPFVGIWATSIEHLHARTATPEIYNAYAEGFSIIKTLATLAKKKRKLCAQTICNLHGGLETLTIALHQAIKDNIFCNQEVQICELHKNSWTIETKELEIQSSHIALACPSSEMASILENTKGIPKENVTFSDCITSLRSITYSPIGILHVCVPSSEFSPSLKGFGFLTSPFETEGLLGTIYTSLIFNSKWSSNEILLTCFCGGSIKPEYSNVVSKDIQEKLVIQLKRLLKIKTCKIINATVWNAAIPIYGKSHYDLEKHISNIESTYAILFHSNIYKGVSIPSRIKESKLRASTLAHIIKKNAIV